MTLLELLQLLKKKLVLVVALPLVFALATGVYSYVFMEDEYTSQVQLYIWTKAKTSDTYASSSDTTASQQLANDVAVLAKSNGVVNGTAKALGLENLNDYKLSVESETTNRVVTLKVVGPDRSMVVKVADVFAKQTADRSVEVMGLEAANIVDDASVPDEPSGPRRAMYIAIALLAGLFLAVAAIVLVDTLDTTVKSREEAEELFGLPVLGTMPEVRRAK